MQPEYLQDQKNNKFTEQKHEKAMKQYEQDSLCTSYLNKNCF